MYSVSTDAAYAVLFSVLGVFTVLAILSAGYGSFLLPASFRDIVVAKGGVDNVTSSDGDEKNKDSITVTNVDPTRGLLATDFFL